MSTTLSSIWIRFFFWLERRPDARADQSVDGPADQVHGGHHRGLRRRRPDLHPHRRLLLLPPPARPKAQETPRNGEGSQHSTDDHDAAAAALLRRPGQQGPGHGGADARRGRQERALRHAERLRLHGAQRTHQQRRRLYVRVLFVFFVFFVFFVELEWNWFGLSFRPQGSTWRTRSTATPTRTTAARSTRRTRCGR